MQKICSIYKINMQNKKFFKSPNDKTLCVYVFIISNFICLSISYKNIMHLHNS